MNYIATITSKRQLTIPSSLFTELKLKEGQKVIVSRQADGIIISPAVRLVNDLAGSIPVPKRFRGLGASEMVTKAKSEYFSGKK